MVNLAGLEPGAVSNTLTSLMDFTSTPLIEPERFLALSYSHLQ